MIYNPVDVRVSVSNKRQVWWGRGGKCFGFGGRKSLLLITLHRCRRGLIDSISDQYLEIHCNKKPHTFLYPQLAQPGGTHEYSSAVIGYKAFIVSIEHIKTCLGITDDDLSLLDLFTFLFIDFFFTGFFIKGFKIIFVNGKRSVPESRH